MHKSFVSLAFLAALLGGCMSMPPSLHHSGGDPSNPSAPEASARRLRANLVATTKVYLDPSAGEDAEKMDMSKMQGNGGRQGMDHSQMQGMQEMDHSKMKGMESKQPSAGVPSPQPEEMGAMHHSKMPGMGAPPPAATASSPASKEAVEMEMKKTSDEMKKLSDELKAKSDAAKAAEKPGAKPEGSAKSPAVFYTCPRHPQIHEAKPGQCPICGVTLVRKKSP